MTQALAAHLWQSTFFALAAGLLTIAFRKNRAQVRYWLWLSASLKFFIPFALLLNLGRYLETQMPAARQIAAPLASYTIQQLSAPFFPASLPSPEPLPNTIHWIPLAILAVWLIGLTTVMSIRFRSWRKIRAAVRASAVTGTSETVEIRVSPVHLEPGVVGIVRPVLLLPEGITERLTPSELETVLAHELCHIRRRDNLFAALHMIVEAAFWFHPLVWWIGAHLVEERERACDEEVLSQGSHPEVYADAILNVCKLYAQSPLACVSGVSGASIRRRIESIMADRRLPRLNRAKKFLLAGAGTAALAGPVTIGLLIGANNAPVVHAQSALSEGRQTSRAKFEVASIRPCEAPADQGGGNRGVGGGPVQATSGRFYAECQTLSELIRFAYFSYRHAETVPHRIVLQEFKGNPAWGDSDRYTIDARGTGAETTEMILGPMLRALLEDRFMLRVHYETRETAVYNLTAPKGASKLQTARDGSCAPVDADHPLFASLAGNPKRCGMVYKSATGDGRDMFGTTLARLCQQLSAFLDRDVIDETGIPGTFDIRLDIPPDDLTVVNQAPSQISSVFSAVAELGLKLVPARGSSSHFLVIDHVERPTEN